MPPIAATRRKRQYAPRLPPAERREQLLDATLGVIDAGGYGAVSMEAIARAAGVTKPVVYDVFGDLGALLAALLEREEERAFAQLGEAIPARPATEPDQLAVDAFIAFMRAVGLATRLVAADPDAGREHPRRGPRPRRGRA